MKISFANVDLPRQLEQFLQAVRPPRPPAAGFTLIRAHRPPIGGNIIEPAIIALPREQKTFFQKEKFGF